MTPQYLGWGAKSAIEVRLSRNQTKRSSRSRMTPVLGFEPRSEAPQASRIIQCSGAG